MSKSKRHADHGQVPDAGKSLAPLPTTSTKTRVGNQLGEVPVHGKSDRHFHAANNRPNGGDGAWGGSGKSIPAPSANAATSTKALPRGAKKPRHQTASSPPVV